MKFLLVLIFGLSLILAGCSGGEDSRAGAGISGAGESAPDYNPSDRRPANKASLTSGRLFNDDVSKWYTYQFVGHFVWSNFDVYLIEHKGQLYKFQILSYYKPGDINYTGYYTVRVQSSDGNINELVVDAKACGLPMENSNYEECVKNPQKNIFTYLDLDTLSVRQMTDAEAESDVDWTIAFKATNLRLNDGRDGPSDAKGQLYYRDSNIFKGPEPNYNWLQKKIQFGFDIKIFKKVPFPQLKDEG